MTIHALGDTGVADKQRALFHRASNWLPLTARRGWAEAIIDLYRKGGFQESDRQDDDSADWWRKE
jgi:hypothetical protein